MNGRSPASQASRAAAVSSGCSCKAAPSAAPPRSEDVAPEHRQDPSWLRTGKGRDGCRVPLPWSGDRPPYGFGPGTGQPWIPQPDDWGSMTVSAQSRDPGSTLAFYRTALAARREHALGAGVEVEVRVDGDLLELRRGPLTVLLNCGTAPVPLPDGEVVVASGAVDGELPPDTAVWVTRRGWTR